VHNVSLSTAPGTVRGLHYQLARKPPRLAAVALVNKMARISWA
jgi:dTDP-4-dehydrorhamnose 3,5-epimerase-like enzyme